MKTVSGIDLVRYKQACAATQTTQLSLVMRKPTFSICENKDADQLHGNREADQRLCFRYTDSTIPLLSKSEISSLWPSSVAVQPGLCQTRSETPKTGFITMRLIYSIIQAVKHKCTEQLVRRCCSPKHKAGFIMTRLLFYGTSIHIYLI